MVRDDIFGLNPEAKLFEDLDKAIIGTDSRTRRVIYSKDLILDALATTVDDPEERFDYSILNAYRGINTPILLEDIKEIF